MDLNFKKNADFLNLIKDKEIQILDKTTDQIQESEGFKIAFAGLKSMVENNDFNGEKVILISEGEIISVKLDEIIGFNSLFADPNFQYNQIIELDRKIKVISHKRERLPEDSNKARQHFSEISKTGKVIFLLIKSKINYFIKGVDKSESPFFSLTDINRYNEKKDISRIGEVFTEYQENLKDRKCYCKFFIQLSQIKSLSQDLKHPDKIENFVKNHKHLLKNKPEDTFRDDLRDFFKYNLLVTQVKEYLLENLQRLDIYLYDEFGEVYFVEVKWVGHSIHKDGKNLGTEYKANIIPSAVHQTLNYLELLAKKGQNIVRAYLVVFDARKDDFEDTGKHFDPSLLNELQKKHFRKFDKVKDLRVINFHPS